MKKRIVAFVPLVIVSSIGTAAWAREKPEEVAAKHATITAYSGTATCSGCHEKQVKDVAASLHYQQLGTAPFLANAQQEKSAGMMVSY